MTDESRATESDKGYVWLMDEWHRVVQALRKERRKHKPDTKTVDELIYEKGVIEGALREAAGNDADDEDAPPF